MIYLEFFVSFVINNLHNKFFSLLFYHGGRAIYQKMHNHVVSYSSLSSLWCLFKRYSTIFSVSQAFCPPPFHWAFHPLSVRPCDFRFFQLHLPRLSKGLRSQFYCVLISLDLNLLNLFYYGNKFIFQFGLDTKGYKRYIPL